LAVLIPGSLLLYTSQILCDLIEEILTPYSNLVGILNKGQDILLSLIVVDRRETGAEQLFQLVNIQRCFRFKKSGLPETCFQMLQIDRRIHGKIEHIVIEIAALDAIFPCPAENGMCLSGKERGLIIQANCMSSGSTLTHTQCIANARCVLNLRVAVLAADS
jgi:hypothetical protein